MQWRLPLPSLVLAAVAALFLLATPQAHAQGGSCRDPWINQAYNQLYHRAPNGSGNSGECNITRYGHGHWSSFADLEAKIRQANAGCRDPWITSAYVELFHRMPQFTSKTTGECNVELYGQGHWSSYNDLLNKVRAANPPVTAKVTPQGGLINLANNKMLAQPGSFAIADGSASNVIAPKAGQVITIPAGVIASGGGNVISSGGGNVIASGGGNVISSGGGNFHVQSLGGKLIIPATSVR